MNLARILGAILPTLTFLALLLAIAVALHDHPDDE